MLYFSTNQSAPEVNFRQATLLGQAPDKGLYFPQKIPSISPQLLNDLKKYSPAEIAFQVIAPYIGDSIPSKELRNIVEETLSFEFPLVQVDESVYALELFHGPTLAFKDVGARFMSRCLGYFNKGQKETTTVLVATSGDTGGAVADGFFGVEGVEVVILYPSGKVSRVQQQQLTTYGRNITAIEVSGTFDDCQMMVKEAFADKNIRERQKLTSANSINIARWLSQQFYYFFAIRQWPYEVPPVISVPSGNFGNICAGLLAQYSGLPIKHFVAACNANDAVPEYLASGTYHPRPAIATLSNAMDVGAPSNFTRILELYDKNYATVKDKVSGYSISDDTTREVIKNVFEKHSYILDPHGAVAWSALKQYLASQPGQKGIFLETAHPVKFREIVEPLTGQKIPLPNQVKALEQKREQSVPMKAEYNLLKDFLMNKS